MPDLNINGHKHHYEDIGAGEPMVFLYYIIDNNAKGKAEILKEPAAGFRLIIPDARGMGASEHTTDVAPADWVEDLLGLLDALSIPSAHIMAQTVGTRVALRFAADYPDRVKSLILDATIAVNVPEGDAWRRHALTDSNMAPEFTAKIKATHGDDWRAVLDWFIPLHEKADFQSYYDGYKLAKRIKAPTLLIHGDLTRPFPVYPLEHSVEMHHLIPGSWLAIYPNTPGEAMSHHLTEVWDLVRRFVKEKA